MVGFSRDIESGKEKCVTFWGESLYFYIYARHLIQIWCFVARARLVNKNNPTRSRNCNILPPLCWEHCSRRISRDLAVFSYSRAFPGAAVSISRALRPVAAVRAAWFLIARTYRENAFVVRKSSVTRVVRPLGFVIGSCAFEIWIFSVGARSATLRFSYRC